MILRVLICLSILAGSFLPVGHGYGQAKEFLSHKDLLPPTTQAMFEVVDGPRFETRWGKTFLGALTSDPALEPFVETQRKAIRERMLALGFAIDISLSDLRDISSGELAMAWVQMQSKSGVALMVDTRGREKKTDELLDRIDKDLRVNRGATMTEETYKGSKIFLYTLKRKRGQIDVEKFSCTLVDGRLVTSDHIEIIRSILDAIEDPKRGSFALGKDYQEVFNKVGDGDDSDLRWFVRPLGFARILKARGAGKKKQLDTIKLLQQQGFDVVLSAGGHLRLDAGKYDVSHNAFVYAPGEKKLAARMLQFPNHAPRDPPKWVLPTVASYLDAAWKMNDAFWAAETLVNQLVGDVIFRPTLDGIKEDKDGPQVDIANDIIKNFDDRLILLTDNVAPISKQSERMLVGVSLKDAAAVKLAIDKIMKLDPNAFEYNYPHHKWIWEVRSAAGGGGDDFESLEGFEDFEEFNIDEPAGAGGNGKPPLLNQWAITVYDGFLLFSSHAKMLVETIDHHRGAGGLGLKDQPHYQRVRAALAEVGQNKPQAIRRIVRADAAMRVKYELFRKGELRDSDSVLAAVIRRMLQNAKSDKPERELRIDAKQLPDFNVIKHHLQPTGMSFETVEDGWFLRGLMLKKPEQEKPEQEKPEQEKPEQEKPEQEKPEQEKPEQEKPEQEKPEQEKPEQEKPEQEKPELGTAE